MAAAPSVRAALYFRQSLDVQEGIDRQRIRCRALAAARDWVVVDEYEDNDTSASKARAAGTAWARMLDDARSKRFDVVIAVDLDRLLRTITDLISLTETGAKVLTVDGEIDLTTADGEFRATMLAGIARFEARRKGERQIRAAAHAASLGRPTGRKAFGYTTDGMTIVPAEAAAIAEGFRDFLSGVPLAAIARSWNAAGFSAQILKKGPKRGDPSPWRGDSVRWVLKNPRYMGKRAHKGEIVADGLWPAIVPESTWHAAQSILMDPARKDKSKPRGTRYLLTGLAVCAVCGASAHSGGNGRAGIPSYRCGGSSGHFSRRSEPVEQYVEAVMVARLSRPDALELLRPSPTVDTAALSLEAVGVRARLDALATEFADGDLTASQLRTATVRMRSRLADIDAALADAGRVEVFGGLVDSNDVGAAWESLAVEKKRAVIGALAAVVISGPGRGVRKFDPNTVGIYWLP